MVKVIIICLFFSKSTGFGALENLFGVENWDVSWGSRQDSVELLTWDTELVVLPHRPAALDDPILSDTPCEGHQNWFLQLFKSEVDWVYEMGQLNCGYFLLHSYLNAYQKLLKEVG